MRKKNILILDDDKVILECLKCILISEGYNVFISKNIFEAEMILVNKKIDLLLSDVNVGDEYGFDLANTATALNLYLPVIMMTGDINGKDYRKAKLAGYDYISKPLDIQSLCNTIYDLLKEDYLNFESLDFRFEDRLAI